MVNNQKYVNVNELISRLNGVFSVRQMDIIKAIIYSCELRGKIEQSQLGKKKEHNSTMV